MTISIDPVTRLEGHLKIEVTVEQVNGRTQVVDARATGTLFRGFEAILQSRPPLDAPDITQRICGVCPVSHGLASSMTLEATIGMTVPKNARVMRNLVLGSNFVQSHILHFYHLAAQDFVNGPDMAPWQPSWQQDKRFDAATSQALVDHYVQALDMRRMAHEMGAIFGGRLPHPPAFVPGGFTTTPRADRITRFKQYLGVLTGFIQNVYIPDVTALAAKYSDHFQFGSGHGNLLAYGVFDLNDDGSSKLLKRGYKPNGGAVQALDLNAITEDVTRSWYDSGASGLNPSAGATSPVDPDSKPSAYSWLKAPRYARKPYEVGALARMVVNGDYTGGVSVMDRHAARAREALKVAQAMASWVAQLDGGAVYAQFPPPSNGAGYGLTEAPRGALGHWAQIASGRTSRYQIITPTCWNASPQDDSGVRGPLEQALIGTPVANTSEPIEVLRVIHSFDPCLSCAVHVMRPAEGKRVFALGQVQ